MAPPDLSPAQARANRRIVLICVAIFVFMTGAAFAAVPLYRAFCQATGFAGAVPRAKVAPTTILAKLQELELAASVATKGKK